MASAPINIKTKTEYQRMGILCRKKNSGLSHSAEEFPAKNKFPIFIRKVPTLMWVI